VIRDFALFGPTAMRGPISPDPERYNAFLASLRTMLDAAS
jgi:hypothetical protein